MIGHLSSCFSFFCVFLCALCDSVVSYLVISADAFTLHLREQHVAAGDGDGFSRFDAAENDSVLFVAWTKLDRTRLKFGGRCAFHEYDVRGLVESLQILMGHDSLQRLIGHNRELLSVNENTRVAEAIRSQAALWIGDVGADGHRARFLIHFGTDPLDLRWRGVLVRSIEMERDLHTFP